MTSLEVVQTLTAGVDNIAARIPDGVTLCSGRGIHDASTAELAVALTLASLRGIPEFVRAQDRHEWAFQWRPALADKRVLLVGYGAIGAAIEARLTPFEVEVVRVARTARDGVHAIDELPELLPDADVVILCRPAHRRDPRPGRRRLPGPDATTARCWSTSPAAPVVVTDDLVAALHDGRIRAAVDVTEPGAAPRGQPALVRARPADLPARRRREQRDVAAGPPPGPRPAAPLRRR